MLGAVWYKPKVEIEGREVLGTKDLVNSKDRAPPGHYKFS
jgi:hypothetical protein